MKKSFAIVMILCIVMAVVLVGCTPENPPIVNKLTSLSIDSSSAKTVYEEGEAFSTAGLIVKAVYDNGEEKVVTDYTVAPSDALGVTDTFVVISYTEEGVTVTKQLSITVNAKITTLGTPNISIDGSAISWQPVANADNYDIYVNNEKVTSITGTTYTLGIVDVGAYNIHVIATMRQGDTVIASAESNKVTYLVEPKVLATPLIAIEGNVVSWQAVENATAYEVYVDGVLKDTVAESSYTLVLEDVAVYSIKVKAITSLSNYQNSEFSNPVTYLKQVNMFAPVVIVNANGNVFTFEGSNVKYLAEGAAYDAQSNYQTEALLIEQVDGGYTIRNTQGNYLVYVAGGQILGNRTYAFADALEEGNINYLWNVKEIANNAGKFTISSKAIAAENYLTFDENGNVVVALASSSGIDVSKFTLTLKACSVAESSFAQGIVKNPAQFDITKPFVGYYENLAAESDRYLGVRYDTYTGTNSSMDNYLIERAEYSPYASTEAVGNCIFQFESVTGTSITIGEKTYSDNLYRIRTYQGKYLTVVKGNYINGGGDDFVTAIDSNIENLWQIWYVPVISQNVVRLQNLGHLYDWQNFSEDISGHALCNRNLDGGITGFYNTANVEGCEGYYNLIVSNVDVTMRDVNYNDLSGKTYFITSAYDKTNRVTVAQRDSWYVDTYDQAKSAEFKFTLEKATDSTYGSVYYIKYANGQYLTFNAWYNIVLTDYTGADNQKFVFNEIAGIHDGYTIHPLVGGKFADVDNVAKLTVFFANYPDVNKAGAEQNGLYAEIMSARNCNWFQRMFILEETTEETFDKPSKAFDLTKPLIMGFKNAVEYDGSYLGMTGLYQGTAGKVEDHLSALNRTITTANVFQFEPIPASEGYDIKIGSTRYFENLYRIRTYDGKYLTTVSGLFVNGAGTSDYVGAYELDKDNLWQVWYVASQNDNVLEIQNVGAVFAWNNDQNYFVNRNYDLSADGAAGFWGYIPDNDAFKVVCQNTDETMQPIYQKDLSGTYTIKNMGNNSNIVYDNTASLRTATEQDQTPDCNLTLEKVVKEGEVFYRIKSSDGRYLTFGAWYSITWEATAEPGDNTLWLFKEVAGVENSYLISGYGQKWQSNDMTMKYTVLYTDYAGAKGLPGVNYVYSEINFLAEYGRYDRMWQLNAVK